MTVRREGDVVHLEGDCPVEEAEALAAILEGERPVVVDMSQCRHPHAALVQVLLRFRPAVEGDPQDIFVRQFIMPALKAGGL